MFLPTNLRPHLGHVHNAMRAITAQASLIHVAVVDEGHDLGSSSSPAALLHRPGMVSQVFSEACRD
jgi:hypothetical protein